MRLDSSENPPAASHSGEAPRKQFIRLFGPQDTKLKLTLFLKDLLIKELLACFDLEFALVVHVSMWLGVEKHPFQAISDLTPKIRSGRQPRQSLIHSLPSSES